MSAELMPIGGFSRRTGCPIETIRFYERVGILPPPRRRGRYRYYSDADIERLSFVRRARELGFTLDQVRALLGLAAAGDGVCDEARQLASAHLADVRRRIADLRAMERVLARSVRACATGPATHCPLIEALASPPPSPTLPGGG